MTRVLDYRHGEVCRWATQSLLRRSGATSHLQITQTLSPSPFCPFPTAIAAKGVQGSLPSPKIGNWMVRAKSHFHVSDPRTWSRDQGGADCEGPVILQIILCYFKPDSGIFSADATGKDRSSLRTPFSQMLFLHLTKV